MKKIVIATAALLTLSGCIIEAPPPRVYVAPPRMEMEYEAPAPQPVVSVYVEPPLFEPPPIRVGWAPPPMLVDVPPPRPYEGAVWTGGYWVWEGNWVWAHGRWLGPPRPDYRWVNPYYENRGGSVVFINGFWAAPGVAFVAPSLSVNIAFGAVAAGVIAGPRPIGPPGVFLPPPPGSRFGLIVPAPIGTPPAVMTGAPPIIRGGMRVNTNINNSTVINNNNSRTINNNVTNVTNITNVTIIAPASATANGRPVNTTVPARPHLAAAMQPMVRALAPAPRSANPIPTYMPGRPPVRLPPAQIVHSQATPALFHPRAEEQGHPAVSGGERGRVPPGQQAQDRRMSQGPRYPGAQAAGNDRNRGEARGPVPPGQQAQDRRMSQGPRYPGAQAAGNDRNRAVRRPPAGRPAMNQARPGRRPQAGTPNRRQQQKANGNPRKKKKANDQYDNGR